MSNIVWLYNYPNGRFANAAFQFVFAKYLEKFGYTVIIGNSNHPKLDTLPWDLFNISDKNISYTDDHKVFLGEERDLGPSNSLKLIKAHFDKYPGTVLCISGYFQFDTSKIRADQNYLKSFHEELGLTTQPSNMFQKVIKKYYDKIKSHYLVTIHVRRGDYVSYANFGGWQGEVFYCLDLDNVVRKLRDYISANRITNFILYIASDDMSFCKEYFKATNLKILTSENFIEEEDNSHLIVDLAAMTAANLFIASNSSLSLLGAMINNCGRVFWRQDKHGNLISFDPWSTPILYGPVLNNVRLK
jgi:hypothetical protein